ncbi:MAG: glycosyltransferase family 4 protein, partial [Pseudomonadota bacterium]
TAIWLRLSRSRQWLIPPNSRSSHVIPTPSGGGIGFVLVFMVYAYWRRHEVLPDWQGALALVGAMLLAFVGLLDDFRNLGIRLRLVLQVVAGLVLLPFLLQMPPLPVFQSITIGGSWLALLLVLALLWHVNLYNFMDGIDALAVTQALFFCLAIPLLAAAGQHSNVMLALGAAVCGFLFFNLPRAQLFMGDAGSYFLGYVLVVLALSFVREGLLEIWTILVLAGAFVADSTTTLLGRFREGAVWYHPHRTHAYQLLAVRWKSHGRVVATYMAINVFWLLPLAWLTVRKPEFGAVLSVVAVAPLMVLVHAVRRSASMQTAGAQ